MRMVQLTDALHSGDNKEFVDALEVARVEPYITQQTHWEETTRDVKLFFFFKKKFVDITPVYSDVLSGSIIHMRGSKDKTFVREKPEEVVRLIAEALNK